MTKLMRKLGWGVGVASFALAGVVFAEDEVKKSDDTRRGTDVNVQIGGGRGVDVSVQHGQQKGPMGDQAQKDLQSGNFVVRRLSKFYSANLYNDKGEDVGDIKNVAIDPQAGQIAFGIVEFDNNVGVGNKHFAIPWSAIHKDVDQKDFNKIAYSMSIDKNKLEQAKGFEGDNWPNLADRSFTRDLYTLWGQQPYWEGSVAQANLRAEPTITGTPISPDQARGQRGMERGAVIVRGNDLVGHKLLDQNGKDFAELEEIMADPKSGTLLYGIVQIDQAPDFSKDYMHPVPWQVINVRHTGQADTGRDMGRDTGADTGDKEAGRTSDERGQMTTDHARGKVLTDKGSFQVVLNVSRDKLLNGPKFGEREWPNMTSQWGEQVYNHYGVRPFWKGGMGTGREGMQERGGQSGQTGDHAGHGHDTGSEEDR